MPGRRAEAAIRPAAESVARPATGIRRLRHGLWLLAALAALALGIALSLRWLPGAPAPAQVSAQASAGIGSHFSLVDRDGRPVTPQTLKGKPYAIFFGFTRCPDVCPTALSRMARLRKALGPDGERFRILFVSVDTGHDRPQDVGAYVDLFGTPILGLTGSDRQIAEAARAFGVFYQKVPAGRGDYTIDHSAFTILMDRDGLFKSILSDADSEEAALRELRALIA